MGKKILKVTLYILLIIALLAGWFIYKQWNSITAFFDAVNYSQEELDEKLRENKDDVQKYIDSKDDIYVRDLTEAESEALNKGNLTEEDVLKILTSKSDGDEEEPEKSNETLNESAPSTSVAPSKQPTTSKTENISAENKNDDKTSQSETGKTPGQKVSEAIAKLYIQKSIYLNKLDEVEAEVRAIFIGMDKEKKKEGTFLKADEQKSIKNKLLAEYLPKVAAWEGECDSIVYGILDEIKAALKEGNGDMTIVNKLEESYLNEKKTKKSYFINRYMD